VGLMRQFIVWPEEELAKQQKALFAAAQINIADALALNEKHSYISLRLSESASRKEFRHENKPDYARQVSSVARPQGNRAGNPFHKGVLPGKSRV
jgi:hypothetical protein